MTRLLLIAFLALLTGCASSPIFTVDDGRKVDETLLAGMSAYGAGERLIRPVATSVGWSEANRFACARALQVDARLDRCRATGLTRART